MLDILRRVPAGLRHQFDPSSDKNELRSAHYPAELGRSELRGLVEGLLLTLFSRLRHPASSARRRAPLAVSPPAPLITPGSGRGQEVSHHAL